MYTKIICLCLYFLLRFFLNFWSLLFDFPSKYVEMLHIYTHVPCKLVQRYFEIVSSNLKGVVAIVICSFRYVDFMNTIIFLQYREIRFSCTIWILFMTRECVLIPSQGYLTDNWTLYLKYLPGYVQVIFQKTHNVSM